MNKALCIELIQDSSLKELVSHLEIPNGNKLVDTITYFSIYEGEKRDKILQEFFTAQGLQTIINSVVTALKVLPNDAVILDVGAGSGFFTCKVAEIQQTQEGKKTTFWALDITPAMLLALCHKETLSEIYPVIGHAEKIKESLSFQRQHYASKNIIIPEQFKGIMSVLALHHCESPEKVFASMDSVLEKNGYVVIVDECEHSFEEYRDEMLDIHLGFNLDKLKESATQYFDIERIQKLPAASCECSGRAVDLFELVMKKKT